MYIAVRGTPELTCILATLHRGSIRSSDLSSFRSFSTLDDNELHTFTITYTPKILFGIILYNCCLHRQMNPFNNSSALYTQCICIMHLTWWTKMSSLLSSLYVQNNMHVYFIQPHTKLTNYGQKTPTGIIHAYLMYMYVMGDWRQMASKPLSRLLCSMSCLWLATDCCYSVMASGSVSSTVGIKKNGDIYVPFCLNTVCSIPFTIRFLFARASKQLICWAYFATCPTSKLACSLVH